MEVYAVLNTIVEVDPLRFIEGLLNETIGRNNWVFEKDGGYYKGYEISRTLDGEDPISKEKYDYIRALELAKEYLSKNNG